MYKFIFGRPENPKGRALIYARLSRDDSSPHISYWENPEIFPSIGDNPIMAAYTSRNPLDFKQKAGISQQIITQGIEASFNISTEEFPEEIRKEIKYYGLPIFLFPPMLEKNLPVSLGVEDLIFSGSFYQEGIAKEMIETCANIYGLDSIINNERNGKKDPFLRGYDEEKKECSYQKCIKDLPSNYRVSEDIIRNYVVPFIDSIRNRNNTEIRRNREGLLSFGKGHPNPNDFIELAKEIENSNGTSRNAETIDALVRKIEAVHTEEFELVKHYQAIIDSKKSKT